jgi:uncharacterized protein YjbJ (UPF0337 family)
VSSDVLSGKWKQLRGEVQKQWGKLTNDELDQVEGEATKLVGLLQEKYGYTRERAEREVKELSDRFGNERTAGR